MKIYPLAIVLAATLAVSCSRDEDATHGGGCRELAVNVQMQNSDWQTRSDADGTSGGGSTADGTQVNVPENIQENTHERTQVLGSVALDEQLEIVAECDPIGYTPDAPLTRGTPMNSASELQSMGFAVYTNSAFTKNCTATYAGGSWNIANNIALDLDKNKYSYYAYAPVVTADNGIKLNEADGKKLTYTAPADITKQPDLCWATPIIDDQTGTVTFAMQHALTAVGIKVRADNVEIQSIKLLGVNTSGTLDLIKSAWTGLGTVKDLAFTLSNNKPATGNDVANITPNDGYLMLPPQALVGDGKKLVIVYKYNGETTWRTGTHLLSKITDGDWLAGQKVSYVIQLKAKFSLNIEKESDVVSTASQVYTLDYTTGSSASTAIDPTVSCYEASGGWISNLTVNRNIGRGTITFTYAQNVGVTARKAKFTITSGFTTKYFELTQLGIEYWIRSSAKGPGKDIERWGGEYFVDISTPPGIAWTVAGTNCTVTPSSGSVSARVKIKVDNTSEKRDVSAIFATNVTGETPLTTTWSGTQYYTPKDYYPTPFPGTNVYVALTSATNVTVVELLGYCENIKGRIPTDNELNTLINHRSDYGSPTGWYWSSFSYGNDIWRIRDFPSYYKREVHISEKHNGRCVRTYP